MFRVWRKLLENLTMKNFNTSTNNRRVCKCCNNTKPIEEFAKAGIVKGIQYYRSKCKPCYSLQKKMSGKSPPKNLESGR